MSPVQNTSGPPRRWRLRPRHDPGFTWLLTLTAALFLAATGLFFYWFLDTTLPWLSQNHPCRGAFIMVLPVAVVSWVLAGGAIRAWLNRRRWEGTWSTPPARDRR